MFKIPIDLHLCLQLARPHSPDDDAPLAGRPQAPLRPPQGPSPLHHLSGIKIEMRLAARPPLSLTLAKDVTERESAHHHENDGKGHVAVYKSKTTRRGRSQPQQRHSQSHSYESKFSHLERPDPPRVENDGPGLATTHRGRVRHDRNHHSKKSERLALLANPRNMIATGRWLRARKLDAL